MQQIFEVTVPVSARVKVKADSPKEADQIARELIDAVELSGTFIGGYNDNLNRHRAFRAGTCIVSASITAISEELCDIEDEDGEDNEPDPETDPDAWKEYHGMVAGGLNDAGRIFNANGLVVEDLNEQERLAAVARRRALNPG